MDLDELSIDELEEELEAAEMSCDGNRMLLILEEIGLRLNKAYETL